MLDRLFSWRRRRAPDALQQRDAPVSVIRALHARLGDTHPRLDDALGMPVRLVLLQGNEKAWIRIVPAESPDDFDPLNTPNLGTIAVFESDDPVADLRHLKASSGFRKSHLDLRSRKLARLRAGDWLDQGFYEYAFYLHIFHVLTKQGQRVDVSVCAGDGETRIDGLACRDAILDIVCAVGQALEAAAEGGGAHA